MLGLLRGGIEEAFVSHAWSEAGKKVWVGENIKVGWIYNSLAPWCLPHAQEGLRSFIEVRAYLLPRTNPLTTLQKRKPVWGNPSAKL